MKKKMSEISNTLTNIESQQKELRERGDEIEAKLTSLELAQVGDILFWSKFED